jgi:hypothetical protein
MHFFSVCSDLIGQMTRIIFWCFAFAASQHHFLQKVGVMIDPLNPGPKTAAANLNYFQWVRLEANRAEGTADVRALHPLIVAYISDLKSATPQRRYVLALTRGTFSREGDLDHYSAQVAALATQLARTPPDVWEIGNEPDGGPPSSWVMSQNDYGNFFRAAAVALQSVLPDAFISTAGFSGGDPKWLSGAGDVSAAHCLGLHPYVQRPSPDFPTTTWGFTPPPGDVTTILDAYVNMWNLPLCITEFGIYLLVTRQRLTYYFAQARMLAKLA